MSSISPRMMWGQRGLAHGGRDLYRPDLANGKATEHSKVAKVGTAVVRDILCCRRRRPVRACAPLEVHTRPRAHREHPARDFPPGARQRSVMRGYGSARMALRPDTASNR